jgi:hypothetical protein
MKKATALVFAMIMMGVLLSGCYSKTCEQAPMSLKGEG